MGWYVEYYIGYKTKDGKIIPLGPYDCFGDIKPILTKSRTFSSNLWEKFNRVSLDETSEELRNCFSENVPFLENTTVDGEKAIWCFWLDVDDLPKGSYIKKGYYLQSDIAMYEKCLDMDEDFDGFYDMLTTNEYLRKMEAELKFGINKPQKDDEGYEIIKHPCCDYSFYAWPDYDSEEYEACLIRNAVRMFDYCEKLPKNSRIVVLQTNG